MDWLDVANQAVSEHHAVQRPKELAQLLALAAERDVKRVLEIGSDAGGTLWAWQQLGAEVFSVSLPNGPFRSGRPLEAHGATVIEGDSHDFSTWLAVDRLPVGAGVDMLFIDGDHTADGVARDVMAYTRFVRPGGLVALHDIYSHRVDRNIEVHKVWAELADAFESQEIGGAWGIGVFTI